MAKKRTRTTKKTAKRSKKTTRSKTLKKKYAPKAPLPARGRAKGSRKNMQPTAKQPRSSNPVDTALTVAKKHYKHTPYKAQDAKKRKKWDNAKKFVRKQKQLTIGLIKDTGNALDKAGAYAEKIAPGLTAFAAENPENPYLAAFAGGVDAAAALHAFINDAADAHEKGHHDRQGVKSLTDTRKYQKLMTRDEGGDMIMFAPEYIDLPPVDEPGPTPIVWDDDL